MGSPVPVVPIQKAKSIHDQLADFTARLKAAIQPILPPGFRGKVQFVVDRSGLEDHNITVVLEFRPPQPRAGEQDGRR